MKWNDWLFAAVAALGCSAAVASAGEATGLFFVGRTDLGWQVHVHELSSGKTRQLTESLGDKRSPKYSASLDAVLFKMPDGRIASLSASGDEKLIVDVEGCADFVLSEKDHTVLVTKMVTGNTQRQLLWKGSGGFPITQLDRYFSASTGSLRQLCLGGKDEQLLVTHMAPPVLERVSILSDRGDSKVLEYRSEEGQEAAYPGFSADGRIILSKRVDESNFDLFVLTGPGLESTPLVRSKDFSEFASTSDSSHVYFERLSRSGEWSLARIKPGTSGAAVAIPLRMQAKEPAAAVLGSNWFKD